MKACIKAWQDIYNQQGLIKDELSLQALNCLFYGPVWKIEKLTTDIVEKMKDEFCSLYPEFKFDHIKIISDQKQNK